MVCARPCLFQDCLRARHVLIPPPLLSLSGWLRLFVCGKCKDPRPLSINTLHFGADAAGFSSTQCLPLPICHPIGQVPLQFPCQSKPQPPSPLPLSVFPPPWFHMGPFCPLLPASPLCQDGLSPPHVLPMSPSCVWGNRTSNNHTDGNGTTDLFHVLFVCGLVSYICAAKIAHVFLSTWKFWPVVGTPTTVDLFLLGVLAEGHLFWTSSQDTKCEVPIKSAYHSSAATFLKIWR